LLHISEQFTDVFLTASAQLSGHIKIKLNKPLLLYFASWVKKKIKDL